MFGLARNHAFVDGNKRIALLATLQFLNANDYDLELLPVEEAYKTVVQVASGSLSLEDLTDWIRDRMKPLPSPVAGVILSPTVPFSLVDDDVFEGWEAECAVCGSTETLFEPRDRDAAVGRLKRQMADHVALVHPDCEIAFAETVDGTGDGTGPCLESGPPDEVLNYPLAHRHRWQVSDTVWRCIHCGLEAR